MGTVTAIHFLRNRVVDFRRPAVRRGEKSNCKGKKILLARVCLCQTHGWTRLLHLGYPKIGVPISGLSLSAEWRKKAISKTKGFLGTDSADGTVSFSQEIGERFFEDCRPPGRKKVAVSLFPPCFPEPRAVVSHALQDTLLFQFQDLLLYPIDSDS